MYTRSTYKADTPAIAEKIPDSDDASKAFQGQVDALRKAERHVAEAAKLPEQHGLTPRQQAFLDQNPEMLDEPERLGRAILQSHQQGFTPDSHEFHAATAANFRNHHLEVAASNTAHNRGYQPGTAEHKTFVDDELDKLIERVNDPKPAPKRSKVRDDSPEPRQAAFVSAPVSRGDSGGGSYGGGNGGRAGRVTLSIAQKEAAKIAGISENEYALNLIRLREAKANGDYGGSP